MFTNVRSQTEIWYQAILEARPDWAGTIALHHGSLEREARDWVEDGLRHARGKLARKRLDAIVLNGPQNLGAGGGDACWIVDGAEPLPIPTGDKRATARAILDQAFALLGRRALTR